MYRRGYYARDLNSGAPIRLVQFVPRFFPRCPLYSFIISMDFTSSGKTDYGLEEGEWQSSAEMIGKLKIYKISIIHLNVYGRELQLKTQVLI